MGGAPAAPGGAAAVSGPGCAPPVGGAAGAVAGGAPAGRPWCGPGLPDGEIL